jgi:hypothetical protein
LVAESEAIPRHVRYLCGGRKRFLSGNECCHEERVHHPHGFASVSRGTSVMGAGIYFLWLILAVPNETPCGAADDTCLPLTIAQVQAHDLDGKVLEFTSLQACLDSGFKARKAEEVKGFLCDSEEEDAKRRERKAGPDAFQPSKGWTL